jgi:site-specific recombinase XerD
MRVIRTFGWPALWDSKPGALAGRLRERTNIVAEIFRPTYTYTNPTTGERTKKKSRTWHVRFYSSDGRRHRVKGFRDRKATEVLAGELERRAARLAAGLVDPIEESAKRPLAEHAEDYCHYLIAKGDTRGHVSRTMARLRACLDACRFIRISDLQPSVVLSFLADLRAKGRSIKTANYYLTALKGFVRWLWKDRRTAVDPLAGMSKLANAETDIRHPRRELSVAEYSWLFATVRTSERTLRGLTGRDRFALYLTAASSGLRASELLSLTPASFDLAATPPVVRLQSAYAKNRKQAELPLSAEVVEVLRAHLAGKASAAPVWAGTWAPKAADMFKKDLADARQAWLSSFQDVRQRAQAESSDFLAYLDVEGRFADFHSLRHLYISRIVRSGATPKVAQTLARHGDVRLTLGCYAHVGLHDVAAAVDSLPGMLPTEADRQALAATGTEGKNLSPNLGPQSAISGDFQRQAETERASGDMPLSVQQTPEKSGFSPDSPREEETGPTGMQTGTEWITSLPPARFDFVLGVKLDFVVVVVKANEIEAFRCSARNSRHGHLNLARFLEAGNLFAFLVEQVVGHFFGDADLNVVHVFVVGGELKHAHDINAHAFAGFYLAGAAAVRAVLIDAAFE